MSGNWRRARNGGSLLFDGEIGDSSSHIEVGAPLLAAGRALWEGVPCSGAEVTGAVVHSPLFFRRSQLATSISLNVALVLSGASSAEWAMCGELHGCEVSVGKRGVAREVGGVGCKGGEGVYAAAGLLFVAVTDRVVQKQEDLDLL